MTGGPDIGVYLVVLVSVVLVIEAVAVIVGGRSMIAKTLRIEFRSPRPEAVSFGGDLARPMASPHDYERMDTIYALMLQYPLSLG